MAKEKQEKELETGIKADASVDVAVEQKEKNTVSETTQTLSASNLIKEFENEQLKKELPEIYVGDTVKVGVKKSLEKDLGLLRRKRDELNSSISNKRQEYNNYLLKLEYLERDMHSLEEEMRSEKIKLENYKKDLPNPSI